MIKSMSDRHIELRSMAECIAIETSGVFGSKTLSFVKSLCKRLYRQSGDPKSTSYLIQRLSIAIQRGNAIFLWNDVNGSFSTDIKSRYDEIVHWRRNVFKVPHGKVGISLCVN